jgi:MFS family permease
MQISDRAIRVNLVLCSVLHGLNHFLLIFYKPMYPQMAQFFGLSSVAEVTTRLTITYVGYGIANFVTGLLARRINLRIVLFFGMILMSLSAAAMTAVPAAGYGWAIVFAFLMGLGGGTYHPAANSLMTSLYEHKQGHAIGILSIGSALGFIAAPLLGTHLGRDAIGFQSMFLIAGGVSFVYAWVFLIFTRSAPRLGQRSVPAGAPVAGALPKAALAVIIVLLAFPTVIRDIINWGYYEVTPYWVAHGFSQGVGVDWVQIMAYLPGLMVQPITGKLCDRLGPFTVVAGMFVIMSGGYALLGFNSPVLIWVGLALYGIGVSATTVANETYMASLVPARSRGIVYGILLSLALGLGGYLGGASGWIIDLFGKASRVGYQVWFFGMGLLTGASVVCYFIIEAIRKKHRVELPKA